MSDPHPNRCPDDETLRAALVDDAAYPGLEAHLSTCDGCRDRLDALAGYGETAVLLADFEHWSAQSAELDDTLRQLVATGRDGGECPPTPVSREEILALFLPADEPGALGKLDDQLVVHEILGQGGMGIVLRARDTALDREVAVKLLKPAFRDYPDLLSRFHDEARAVAALDHENIVPIHRVGALPNGLPFFVMPLARGSTLAQRLREKGRPPFPDALAIAIRTGRALAAAHAAGIVHRDLKPGNLLLGARSDDSAEPATLWLSDFGLASRTENESAHRGGTPGYLAPELLAGEPASPSSDLYALGCLLADLAGPDAPVWFLDLADELRRTDPAHRPRSAAEVVLLLERRDAARDSRERRRLLFRRALPFALAGLVTLAIITSLDLSGRTSIVNDALRAANGDAFTLRGRFGTHGSLAGAIQAARDGERIVIHGVGPFSLNPTGRRDIDLAFHADPRLDRRPVLTLASDQIGPAALIWINDGDLELVGLEFSQRAAEKEFIHRRSPALVRVNKGSLLIRDCRLTREGLGPESDIPLVMATDCHRLEIRASEFLSDQGPCVQWRTVNDLPEAVVEISDSTFSGRLWFDFVVTLGADVPPSRLDFTARDCEVRTPDGPAVSYRRASQNIDLLLRTESCHILTDATGLIGFGVGNGQQLRRSVTLRDRGSVFSPAPGGIDEARRLWRERWGEESIDEDTRWVGAADFPARHPSR